MKTVDAYWSHQSPYCYFALDRLLDLNRRADVDVVLKPVLPGVIRDAELFKNRSEIELRYFMLDVARTAAFLDIPYAEANPYPVEFEPGSIYRAAEQQPRIFRLYYLTAAAIEMGRGWEFLDRVSRMIWDGSTRNWHDADRLRDAIEKAGLDFDALSARADEGATAFDRLFAQHRETMLAAGHWGVPMFVYRDEPFYGQDRFEQLLWRLSLDS